jgi:acyl-CoA synthetase (AMP-forming)/AMP-acid ligase II
MTDHLLPESPNNAPSGLAAVRAAIVHYGPRPLMIDGTAVTTYAQFGARIARFSEQLAGSGVQAGTTVVLHGSGLVGDWAALVAMWQAGCVVLPESRRIATPSWAEWLAEVQGDGQLRLVVQCPTCPRCPLLQRLQDGGQPGLLLWSGGTTGAPRIVVHDAIRFLGGYTLTERGPQNLLSLYQWDHIAGIDAQFQAMMRGATLVRAADSSPQAIADALVRHRVHVMPATPSMLQFLLVSGALDGVALPDLHTVVHGAEPMPSALRARWQAQFPASRLMQRFGTTELHALPVEQDPVDAGCLLLQKVPGWDWAVRDGELWVRSPRPMLGYLETGVVESADGWYATGDRAELTERGSVRVLGRLQSFINVGGNKVFPEAVEALLLELPGVQDAQVHAVPHALTGQAVCATLQLAVGATLPAVRAAIRRHMLAAGADQAMIPTVYRLADGSLLTPRGKKRRSEP